MKKGKILFYATLSAIIIFIAYHFALKDHTFENLKDSFDGNYKSINSGNIEIWETNESVITGENFDPESKAILEKMSIIKIDDLIYYAAKPREQEEHTFFKMIVSEGFDFSFHNKENDFPKFIRYKFSNDTLITSIWNDFNKKSDTLIKE